MALKLALKKENNHIYSDFNDSYWVIEDLRFENNEGEFLTVFYLNAYPSREASKKTGEVITALDFGRPMGMCYEAKLYEYVGVFPTSTIFPQGIPLTLEEQKRAIYPFIKEFLNQYEWEDVIEDSSV